MDLIAVIMIGVSLSMDAFAVSVLSGTVYKELKVRHALKIAMFFGGFQAIMPLAGHLLAVRVQEYTRNYDHWIAFVLLSVIGVKMIYESFKLENAEKALDPSKWVPLFILSVATSVDALAAGITLSLIAKSVMAAVLIIGFITFCLSYAGVFVGKKIGHLFENKLEALGGFILIGLGLKILFEHLFSS